MAGKKNRRLARAKAMNDAEAKALAAGFTAEEAAKARKDVHDVMTEKMQPTAIRVLKKNVAEFGKTAGAVLGAVGGAVATLAPIGTVIGAACAAAGMGLNAAGTRQAEDLKRFQTAKARMNALNDLVAGGGTVEQPILDPYGENPQPSAVAAMVAARPAKPPEDELPRDRRDRKLAKKAANAQEAAFEKKMDMLRQATPPIGPATAAAETAQEVTAQAPSTTGPVQNQPRGFLDSIIAAVRSIFGKANP